MRTARSGSSQSISPCASRRDQQAKARRKPGRGGESHQRASSDTGGGLPVIPRRILVMRARGEGALGDGRRPGTARNVVFDETAPKAGQRPEAMGIRSSRPVRKRCGASRIRRGRKRTSEVVSQARPAVDNAAGGSLARRSLRSKLHQDRARPHTWTWEPRLPGAREDCGRGRSWRIAVKRGSTR